MKSHGPLSVTLKNSSPISKPPLMNKITLRDYALFVEAWCFLAVARFMLLFVPFRRILAVMGQVNDSENNADHKTPPLILKDIKLAIGRAAKRSPWRTMCFEQALAAKFMLKNRRLESIIYFGAAKNTTGGQKLLLHAWLDCRGENVTGGKNKETFTIIGSFKN